MAKLKAILKAIDEVDEKYRDLYEKADDDTYVLSTDTKDALEEFRRNNRTLKKKAEETEAQLARFKDIDPEKYAKAMAAYEKIQESEDARLIAEGKLDEVLAKRTEAMKRDYTLQIEAKSKALNDLQAERDAYRGKLTGLTIDQEIQKAVTKVGNVRKGALDDVLLRARRLWTLDEKGNVAARHANGEAVYGKEGEPLKIDEWAKSLLDDAPHLFEAGQGGGAGGGKRNDAEGNVKTISGNDPLAFGRNAAEIAKGKVVVR